MGFDWYKSNDTDLADTSYTLSTAAGTPSAAIELHAWLNKGSSVGSSEVRYLRLYVEDSGVYKTSGLDVLDRREIECRIIGSQNPDGVVGFSAPTTAWKPIGTRRSFQLPAIYPNCCIELEFRHNPTAEGGQSTPVTFRVKAVQGTGDVPMSIPDDVSVDGDLPFGSHRITGLPHPLLSTDEYDAPTWGGVMMRPVKHPVRVVADSDVATLSGEQTVDGVALTDGHRVLLTNQTTGTENGIWIVRTGAWERGQDANSTYNTYNGIMVWVRFGTYASQLWVMTTEMTDYTSDEQTWVMLADAAP